jgi:hypothetical protein
MVSGGGVMPANFTTFTDGCKFCGSTHHGLSSSGPGMCQPCSISAAVCGPRSLDVTPEQYAATVREVAGIVDRLPQQHSESWTGYKARIIAAVDALRTGMPLADVLLKPLPKSVLEVMQQGGSLGEALHRVANEAKVKAEELGLRKSKERQSRVRRPADGPKLW